MYVIIEFHDAEDNSVAIVRKSWLSPRKRDVFWPPIKNQKAFDRTLESKTNDEDIEKWKTYPVARCLYETDDLEKAKKKLKLSEVTSDLLTSDEHHSAQPIQKKRKVVTPRRYISSSEEEADSDSNIICPPQLNKKLKNILRESQCGEGDYNTYKSAQEVSGRTSQTTPSHQIVLSGRTSQTKGSQEVVHVGRESCSQDNIDSPLTPPRTPLTRPLNIANRAPHHRADNSNDALLESAGFHGSVLNLLSHIKIQNAQILALLQNKEGTPMQKCPFTFPMKSSDDIQALEDLLEDSKQVDTLIYYLSTIGGRDITSKISRILKHMFTDALAAQYSFYGKRSNKKPFADLRLKTAVLNSIKKSCPETTDKDIEDAIKIWLKHAPDREKIKLKRANKNNQNINNFE